MGERKWQVCAAVVPVSMLALTFFGCAKEPVTTRAMAPGSVGSSGIGTGDSSGAAQNGGAGQDGMSGSARGNAADLSGAIGAARGGDQRGRGSALGGGDWDRRAGENGAGGQAGRGGGQRGGADATGGGSAGVNAGLAGGGGGVAGDGSAGGAGVASANGAQSGTTSLGATRPEPKEFTPVTELRDIHFDFDSYDVRPEAAKMLAANAEWLRAHPRDLILIEGHCDDRGTNEYNLALGHHRAESTMNYLVTQGVQANLISVISYGEERPLCTEDAENCWARNRRAHFLVRRR